MRQSQLEHAVLDTIQRVAPECPRTMVLGEALRNAAVLEVPAEDDPFIEFVLGPLHLAAVRLIGAKQARALCAQLLVATVGSSSAQTEPAARSRTIPPTIGSDAPNDSDAPREGSAPRQSSLASGRPAGSGQRRRIATLDFQAARADVVVVDADPVSRDATRALFEERGYGVVTIDDPAELAALCQAVKPYLVVASVRQAGSAIKAKRKLSKLAPAMLFVTHESGTAEPPLHGIEVVSRLDERALLSALREQEDRAGSTPESA